MVLDCTAGPGDGQPLAFCSGLLFGPLQPDCRQRKSELSAHTWVPRSRDTWKETWDLFSNRFYDSKKASGSSNSGGKSVREVGITGTSGARPALNTTHLPSWVVLASSVDTPSSVRKACCLAHQPATSEPLGGGGGGRGNGFWKSPPPAPDAAVV